MNANEEFSNEQQVHGKLICSAKTVLTSIQSATKFKEKENTSPLQNKLNLCKITH